MSISIKLLQYPKTVLQKGWGGGTEFNLQRQIFSFDNHQATLNFCTYTIICYFCKKGDGSKIFVLYGVPVHNTMNTPSSAQQLPQN